MPLLSGTIFCYNVSMTIKKTVKVRPLKATPAAAASVSDGGAIADRFRLDAPDPRAQKAPAGKGTTYTVVAGVLALLVAGILTFMLYKHWEYLMPW